MTITGRLETALTSHYRLERQLDGGGMAVVYVAHDLRHNRKVAIKVFRPELSAVLGAERFHAEIQISARLQHPHILPLFDSGSADGLLYYVMPFVEGESLRDKLVRETQLPVDEAVRIGRQAASALDYAHRHGVVHRDIKPENILLQEGEVLVADFGIALAVEQSGGSRLTQTGLSLGTPQYMSPEQATGERQIDARTDIYSLGVVVYEMLAGAAPHTGPTVQAVIAKILTDNPRPLTEVRRSTPPHVSAATQRALARIPADRFASVQQFADALTTPQADSSLAPSRTGPSAERTGSAAGRMSRRTAAIFGAVAVVALFAGAGLMRALDRSTTARPVRFTIATNEPQMDRFLGQLPLLTLTPDGSALVYSDSGRLNVRRLDSFESVRLPGTEGATAPAFSPDGRLLVFGQGGRLRRVSVNGGPISDVATANYRLGAYWADDGYIYFSAGLGDRGIWRVPSAGGEPVPITKIPDGVAEQAHGWPQVLPGGRDLLFTVLGPSGGSEDSRIAVQRIGSDDRKPLIEHAVYARYLRSGHLLYSTRGGALFAVPYDVSARRVTGVPAPLLDDVTVGAWGGSALVSVSDQGTLLYVPGGGTQHHVLQLADRAGRSIPLAIPPGSIRGATFSPDGKRIAATVRAKEQSDIWLFNVATGEPERFTFEVAEEEMPIWSPDGQTIAYASAWSGQVRRIMVKEALGGTEPRLVRQWGRHIHLTSWRNDKKWVAGYDYHPINNEDVWLVSVENKDSLAIATTPHHELNPTFSPDGKWLAYQSDESGRFEVYVVSVPSLTVKRQISTSGGAVPRWDRSGTSLIFLQPRRLMTVPVSIVGGFSTRGTPIELFKTSAFDYDVAPNGARFLLDNPNPNPPTPPIHVVVNWFSELQSANSAKK